MFSRLYIDMCKQATEIQRNWRPNVGDFVALGDDVSVIIYSFRRGDKVKYKLHLIRDREFDRDELIWLPTQRQLQDILHSGKVVPVPCLEWQYIATEIWGHEKFFRDRDRTQYWRTFRTYEELWLAYLMYESYDKCWDEDKKEWVRGCRRLK